MESFPPTIRPRIALPGRWGQGNRMRFLVRAPQKGMITAQTDGGQGHRDALGAHEGPSCSPPHPAELLGVCRGERQGSVKPRGRSEAEPGSGACPGRSRALGRDARILQVGEWKCELPQEWGIEGLGPNRKRNWTSRAGVRFFG